MQSKGHDMTGTKKRDAAQNVLRRELPALASKHQGRRDSPNVCSDGKQSLSMMDDGRGHLLGDG